MVVLLVSLARRAYHFQQLASSSTYFHECRTYYLKLGDTYGHNFGDQLLQQVAARLAGALQGNEMIARLGGDEFLFVSSIKDISEISDLVVRLKVTRNTPFTIQNISINLKYSIGVAVYPDNGDTVEALIHAADTAMYHAKLQGKTYCVASNTGIEDIIPLQESVKIVS
ncbi:diguanylate cyclase domain-containing protein [Vibrio zhugei]|nr:GGDEF domain-containing protein [Vibrio zhugei]